MSLEKSFLFPLYLDNDEHKSELKPANPGWYIGSLGRPSPNLVAQYNISPYNIWEIAWEPKNEENWCFATKIDCIIACNSLIQAGYTNHAKMTDLCENNPEIFKRIACENLRW